MLPTNSAFFWLLIRPISTYGLVTTAFWSQVLFQGRLGHKCLIWFLSQKEGETCWGLSTKTAGDQLSFPTPTQTHVFDNHSNSYSCLGTAHMRSSADHWNLISRLLGGLATVSNGEDYIFYSCILGYWFCDLMMQLILIVLTKKRNDLLLRIVRVHWHNSLKHRC
jgi:hypothetical protein